MPPPPPPGFVGTQLVETKHPWYFKNGAVVVGLLLGIWPGLVLLAVRPPRSRRKTIISISAVVLLLIVSSLGNSGNKNSAASGDSVETTTSTTVALQSYKEFLKPGTDLASVWNPVCGKLKNLFASSNSKFDSLIKIGNKYENDPYGASDLLSKNSWWNEAAPLLDATNTEMASEIAVIINSFLTDEGFKIATSSRGAEFNQVIANDAELACGVRELIQTVEAKAETLQSLRINIRLAASQVPWYPKGYSEYESGVAWKWLNSGQISCSYSSSSCWGMNVISQTGCNSLYVEINILDSAGNNIGFTNDTTSGLRPGQTAKLIFDSFEDAASRAQLSKISCY